ncbi:MAG TPA: DNA gyrase subunit B [Gemmatales bacterium]|nr:DNA gyrase subunit B [Gemmatales bacterium]
MSTTAVPLPPDATPEVQYEAKDIQVLKNAAHVRQNPGMYIGDVGSKGLHHLVYEAVHNSVDEAMAGYCQNITVQINVDGSISIADDGRGIPVEMHPTENRPTLELVMCEVGAGGKFRKDSYKVSAGLHGIGVKAVNALSEWTEVQVSRGGKAYRQEYERGWPTTPIQEIGAATKTGTKITFRPDPEVFHETQFSYDTLEHRLRELAFLNRGLAIRLVDEAQGREDSFQYSGGIQEYVEYLNRSEEAIHPAIFIEADRDDVHVEVAFQYNHGDAEVVYSYVNNVHTPVGGTHLSGFRGALTRSINHYGGRQGLVKESLSLIGDDFREGLTAIVSVRVAHPQFESQTKIRLNNPEVEGAVGSSVNEFLGRFLEENPQVAKKIVQKIVLSAEAREAAAKARKQLKDRKTILSGGGLPGKLMDCTSKNRDECELFLVEGDSAGGSAASGRDSHFQAVLPLRGKILNVEKARLEKMLANEEICNIISAMGTDIAESEDVSRRNYEKLILLTDADVDGSHIRTLILTFLYRQMPKLVAEGHIYLAQPPLFRVIQRKTTRYVQTREAMEKELLERGLAGAVLRSAGVGGNGEKSPTPKRGKAGAKAAAPPAPAAEAPGEWSGDRLRLLTECVGQIEHALHIFERRGMTLGRLLATATPAGLPPYRVLLSGQEHWFATAAEVQAFCKDAPPDVVPEIQELHEVKSLSRGLEKLRDQGLTPEALLPPVALAGQAPQPRWLLVQGGHEEPLFSLRELPAAIRAFGERGIQVTRFKGLGEMNPDELWDTTLDPAKRTLMQVRLEDVVKADELFRVLMGDKVEPRREFIEKHALEVRNLDV